MDREKLRKQWSELIGLYLHLTSSNYEWTSVGMNPPKEDADKLKAISRKVSRLSRQLKIERDV